MTPERQGSAEDASTISTHSLGFCRAKFALFSEGYCNCGLRPFKPSWDEAIAEEISWVSRSMRSRATQLELGS